MYEFILFGILSKPIFGLNILNKNVELKNQKKSVLLQYDIK